MKTVIFSILIACGIVNAYAQESTSPPMKTETFLIGYQVTSPNNTGYLTETSWAGGHLEYRRMIKSNLSVGISAGWNTFEQYFPRTTVQKEDGTGAITSDLIRNIYTVPITANVHHYFTGKRTNPYVGLGLGTQFKDERHFANIYQFSAETWGFLVKPEVGIMTQFSGNVGGFFNVSYNYDTSGSDIFDQEDWQHWAFTLGLAF